MEEPDSFHPQLFFCKCSYLGETWTRKLSVSWIASGNATSSSSLARNQQEQEQEQEGKEVNPNRALGGSFLPKDPDRNGNSKRFDLLAVQQVVDHDAAMPAETVERGVDFEVSPPELLPAFWVAWEEQPETLWKIKNLIWQRFQFFMAWP